MRKVAGFLTAKRTTTTTTYLDFDFPVYICTYIVAFPVYMYIVAPSMFLLEILIKILNGNLRETFGLIFKSTIVKSLRRKKTVSWKFFKF
jgi:hypothetical protein